MTVKEIILHCSATPEGKDFTVDDIKKWHLQRGFKDIGYHYVIYRDGTVKKGRKDNENGAHCVGHNSTALGICYIGGMDAENKRPKDTRTTEQHDALLNLVEELMTKYKLTLDKVYCHNNFAKKDCPSFQISEFRDEYTTWATKKLQEKRK